MKRQSFCLVFAFFWLGSATAQPTYNELKSIDGEVFYRYNDGYTILRKDFDESERLQKLSHDKWYKKDYSGALIDGEEAVRLNQKNYYAWLWRGMAREYGNKDYEGAISDFSKAIDLIPHYEVAWVARGSIKLKKGDYNGAITDLNEAIRLKPLDAMAWNNRGSAKSSKGDYDGAIIDFNEAIRLEPKNAYPYNNRGYAKEQKGELEEAINDYRKALEIDPNHEYATKNLPQAESKLAYLKSSPNVHILAVGIGKYQHDYALNSLEFTVPGALKFAHLYELRGLARRVPVLNDSKARRRAILDSLEAFTNTKRVLPNDLMIFYFSGHGLLTGGKLGICPYDYQTSADLIEDKTITEILSRCPARHKICLIEACKNETSADVLDPAEVRRFNESRRNLSAGIVYMTSTEVGKKSWGNTEGGYFTLAIIEGLDEGKADTNGDRTVSAHELFDYVKKTVSSKKPKNNKCHKST